MKLENCKEKCFTFSCGCRGLSLECMHFITSCGLHFHSQTEPISGERGDLFCREPCSTKQEDEVGSPSSLEVYTLVFTHFTLGPPLKV